MTGAAIGTALNYGWEGQCSRLPGFVTEARVLKSGSGNVSFGRPVVQNTDDTYSDVGTVTLTAANFGGIALAEVKQQTTYVTGVNQANAGFYSPLQLMDVLKLGTVTVKCSSGTPTSGGAVHVRTVLNGAFPTEVVGDFRTSSDSTNTVQVTNCCWYSNRKDANGMAELKIKTVNN